MDKNIEKVYEFIINSLRSLDNLELENYINDYLELTNNKKYKKLINKVLELDRVLESKYKKNTKFILENIKSNNTIKRTRYNNGFYECINENNLELASIYLEIIGCLEDIREEHNLYKNYKKLLDDKLRENGLEVENNFLETEFLKNRIEKLRKNKGLVLISPNSDKERNKIHEYIKNIPNINSETITYNNIKSVALTYVSKFGTNSNNIIREALSLYYNSEYEKAIELFKELIDMGRTEHYIFGNIGVCYLNLRNPKKALDYLKMAYCSAPDYQKDDSYHSIIHSTEYLLDKKNNRKENIEKRSKRTRLTDVLYLIYEENYSLEDACKHFSLNENNINLVKLACVIIEYRNSNYSKGDLILKSVERSKDKTKFVKQLFEEVRKNKMFYKNRQELKLNFELR